MPRGLKFATFKFRSFGGISCKKGTTKIKMIHSRRDSNPLLRLSPALYSLSYIRLGLECNHFGIRPEKQRATKMEMTSFFYPKEM
jgi:hypothetical protein